MRILLAAASAVALVACAGAGAGGGAQPASASATNRYTPPEDPYPSTYRPSPSAPTAITGATLYAGEGARIENGTIVMADGRIQAVGGPDTPIPEGVARIDGTGLWVTPGVIDVHSHLGDYPSPGVSAHSDGNEATSPVRPEVW